MDISYERKLYHQLGLKLGARKERQRIRRLQKGWVEVVRGFIATVPVTSAANSLALDALSRVDNATRAPKRKTGGGR